MEVEPGRTWTVRVIDDGGGIDPDAALRPGGGTGLTGMKRRADTIGADLSIDSTTNGTTVTLTFDPSANDVRTR